MTSKKSQNNIRQQLLNDGTIKQTVLQPSAITHKDPAESRAAAIAARRMEMQRTPDIKEKR